MTPKFSLDPHVSRIFDLSPDAIFVDSAGVIVYANAAAARLFQVPDPSALVGLRGERLRDASIAEAAEQRIRELVEHPGNALPFVERRYRRLNGTPVDVEVAAFSYAEAGRVYIVVTARDVTERRRAALSLAHSEARFHDFASASGEWFWETDAEGRYTWFSHEVERVTGFAREWHYGKKRLDLAVAAGVDLSVEPWQSHVAALERHEAFRDFRYLRRAPDGLRWVRSSGVPVFALDGEFRGYRGTGVDISRQVDLEKQTAEAESRYRALLDGIPDRAWLKDVQGRYVAINRSEELAHGIPAALVIGRNVTELRPADQAQAVNEEDRAAMTAAGPMRFERLSNRGDGSWLEIIKTPIRTAHGDLVGMVGISRDITDRKEAEFALVNLKARLERALEGSNLSLWETDLRNGEVYLSASWAELLGNARAESRSTIDALSELVHPDDLPEVVKVSGDTVKGLQSEYSIEHRVRSVAGDWIWIVSSGKVSERDSTGRAVRMTGTNRDISFRKRSETALRESELRYRALFELAPDPIVVTNGKTILFVNPATVALAHATQASDLVGRDAMSFVHPDSVSMVRERLARLLSAPGSSVPFLELKYLDLKGSVRKVETGAVSFASSGEVHILMAIRDMSERISARERIESLNSELEERVRLRTAELEALVEELETFHYAVAHDLHTSLGVISVNAGMLVNDLGASLSREHQHVLARIGDNAQLTARLLDDLLAYSRLGREPVRRGAVSMRGTVHDAWRRLLRIVPDREILFEVGDLPDCNGDARMLAQLWTRLLSNAVKFTRGRTPARVAVGYLADRQAYIVRDNGIGFDMQYAEKLFGVFERLHQGEGFEGTGVGLAIAARIVRRHGGRIWAEARPGEGATFCFSVSAELAT